MRSLASQIIILICLFGTTDVARANCAVINAVDKLHAVQVRLSNMSPSPLFAADMIFIQDQLNEVTDRQVQIAVDGGTVTTKGATFLQFMQNTRTLSQQTGVNDLRQVRAYLRDPNVRQNRYATGRYLADMRCRSGLNTTDATTALSDSADGGTKKRRALGEGIFDLTNLFIFTILVIGGIAARHAISSWLVMQRRRSKRHPAKFKTMYKIGDQTKYGVLHDISGVGTKLAHDHAAIPAPNAKVEVLLFDDWMAGQVRWSNTHYSGVQFQSSLKTDIVRRVSKHTEVVKHTAQEKNGTRPGAVLK